jgi:flagellar hook-basal body complex protein FliE
MDITNYGSAMSGVTPGTFVPDIAPGTPKSQPLADGETGAAGAASFKDTLQSMLGNVNDQMLTAQQKSTDLALGKSNDETGTVKAVEEASLAMQFTMAIRNKIMDAYTEVERMQF